MIFLIWTTALFAAVYLYLKHVYGTFKKRDIHYLKPVPLFGNLTGSILQKEHTVYQLERLYKSFPEDRFVGHFELINGIMVILDPELIKQICVKDFDHFLDHRSMIAEENDPLFGKNLFSLKGQKWRDMRSTLSPAFTGSKMRLMVPFMNECGRDMIESLEKEIKKSQSDYLDIEMKDLCTRYSNDVVASCAFGLKINSHHEKDNGFYNMAKIASTFSFFQLLKFFGFMSFPTLMTLLGAKMFPKNVSSFYRSLVTSTMRNREENNIVRPDMIHLLMQAKKGTLSHESKREDDGAGFATVEESEVLKNSAKREWTEDDLIAQAVLFFIAGFDTVATVMTFVLYELALNPEIQDKLFKELQETLKNSGELDYQVLQTMKYLDMVVSEGIRKWPPGIAMDRICTKAYNLGKPHPKAAQDVIINPGQGIWCAVYPIHRDPNHYPEPDKFIPERFSEENKHSIDPNTYLPFGLGPRNCIGSRFALMEVKMLICQLLSKFRVEPSSKTTIPLVLSPDTFNLKIKGGHWLRIRPRKSVF